MNKRDCNGGWTSCDISELACLGGIVSHPSLIRLTSTLDPRPPDVTCVATHQQPPPPTLCLAGGNCLQPDRRGATLPGTPQHTYTAVLVAVAPASARVDHVAQSVCCGVPHCHNLIGRTAPALRPSVSCFMYPTGTPAAMSNRQRGGWVLVANERRRAWKHGGNR